MFWSESWNSYFFLIRSHFILLAAFAPSRVKTRSMPLRIQFSSFIHCRKEPFLKAERVSWYPRAPIFMVKWQNFWKASFYSLSIYRNVVVEWMIVATCKSLPRRVNSQFTLNFGFHNSSAKRFLIFLRGQIAHLLRNADKTVHFPNFKQR